MKDGGSHETSAAGGPDAALAAVEDAEIGETARFQVSWGETGGMSLSVGHEGWEWVPSSSSGLFSTTRGARRIGAWFSRR